MRYKTSGDIYLDSSVEQKALEEVKELEAKLADAMKSLLDSRRKVESALQDLNEKYLILGFQQISMGISEGK